MNPGKSVRFEGSKLLPTTAKSFLSNSNSNSGNNRNRNKNELNESLLPNEYEMSQGIINSNSNGYNSGSNSSNSGNNGLKSSINRSNVIVGGSLSSASAVSPSLLSRDNPSIIGSTNVNINATDESNNSLHNNRYDDDNYNDDSNIDNGARDHDDANNNNSNGVVNVDSNKIYLKNMKRAKRMIKEGYEWDVCLVLPNIEHEDYTDVPMREGYISMYSM